MNKFINTILLTITVTYFGFASAIITREIQRKLAANQEILENYCATAELKIRGWVEDQQEVKDFLANSLDQDPTGVILNRPNVSVFASSRELSSTFNLDADKLVKICSSMKKLSEFLRISLLLFVDDIDFKADRLKPDDLNCEAILRVEQINRHCMAVDQKLITKQQKGMSIIE